MHLGFDRSAFPGHAVMASLRHDTPLRFTGFHLAPADGPGDRSWMPTYSTLREQGWGFMPVYRGRPDHSATQGVLDAAGPITPVSRPTDAASLMELAGFPAGTTVYLDIASGSHMPAAQAAYVVSWVCEINANSPFRAGVRCSRAGTAGQVEQLVGRIPTWVHGQQHLLPAEVTGGTRVVDLAEETGPGRMTDLHPEAVVWEYPSGHTTLDLRWNDRVDGRVRTLHGVDLACSTVPDPAVVEPGRFTGGRSYFPSARLLESVG